MISSILAEQNHSSALIHLNDGNKYRNSYFEHPENLIKDLFARQRYHINKWNDTLYKEHVKMETELVNLRKIIADPNLIMAAIELNKSSYENFKITRNQ